MNACITLICQNTITEVLVRIEQKNIEQLLLVFACHVCLGVNFVLGLLIIMSIVHTLVTKKVSNSKKIQKNYFLIVFQPTKRS